MLVLVSRLTLSLDKLWFQLLILVKEQDSCKFFQDLIQRVGILFSQVLYIMCLLLETHLCILKTRMVFYFLHSTIIDKISLMFWYLCILMLWRFQGDFTHILSIFLILFFTIFYLCICSWFLGIFLFLLVVSSGKTFVFQIVVCRFKLKLLQWLLELLIFEYFYCNALVLQFALNKFDNFFEERILSNKLDLD